MSRAYYTTANDTGRPIVVAYRYRDPAVGSLSDTVPTGTPVVAIAVPRGGGPPIIDRRPATIVSSTGGVVTLRYNWESVGQVDTPGTYDLVWEAAISGGPITIPTPGATPIIIEPDLG